jgi:hypothetical protein
METVERHRKQCGCEQIKNYDVDIFGCPSTKAIIVLRSLVGPARFSRRVSRYGSNLKPLNGTSEVYFMLKYADGAV